MIFVFLHIVLIIQIIFKFVIASFDLLNFFNLPVVNEKFRTFVDLFANVKYVTFIRAELQFLHVGFSINKPIEENSGETTRTDAENIVHRTKDWNPNTFFLKIQMLVF